MQNCSYNFKLLVLSNQLSKIQIFFFPNMPTIRLFQLLKCDFCCFSDSRDGKFKIFGIFGTTPKYNASH